MSRTPAYREAVTADGGDAPLILLEIAHPDLTDPIRVVQDTTSITVEGNVYQPLAFDITLPDAQEGQLPKARLAMDNVGREMARWIDRSAGGAGATVRILQVLRADPDTLELDVTMNLTSVQMTATKVTADLEFRRLLHRPAVSVRYTPETAPGLF